MWNSRITYLSVVLLAFSRQLCEGADVVCESAVGETLCLIHDFPPLRENEPLNIISSNPQRVNSLETTYQENMKKLHKEIFETFPSLAYVKIFETKISRINRADLENGTNVEQLKLNSNQIEDVEDASFSGLSKTTKLDLGYNKLRIIRRNTFEGLVNLTHLILSFNQIETIEAGAFNLPHLQYLHLKSNKLTTISRGIFRVIPPLTDFNIANNSLTKIGDFLDDMSSLQRIDLADTWPVADLNFTMFAKMPKLETLYIARSPFKATTEEDLATAESAGSKLEEIWLSEDQLNHHFLVAIHRVFENLEDVFISSGETQTRFPIDEIEKVIPDVEIHRF